MIIWLASYPRSGNTLTRQILKQAFGVASYSRYNDQKDIADYPETARRAGHQPLPAATWSAAYSMLRADPQTHVVKTHHPPEDGSKAIYVVRHPCAAIVSFVHYQMNVRGRRFTPAQITLGLPRGINWGGHLDAWAPLTRPDTLVLRFEELLSDTQHQIARIAEFMGLEPKSRWSNPFAELQRDNPGFFRSGQVDLPWDELGAEGRRLLELVHGDWMSRLGYGEAPGMTDAPLLRRHLSDSVRTLLAAQSPPVQPAGDRPRTPAAGGAPPPSPDAIPAPGGRSLLQRWLGFMRSR